MATEAQLKIILNIADVLKQSQKAQASILNIETVAKTVSKSINIQFGKINFDAFTSATRAAKIEQEKLRTEILESKATTAQYAERIKKLQLANELNRVATKSALGSTEKYSEYLKTLFHFPLDP